MAPAAFQGGKAAFRGAIVGQESGGRYGVVNPTSGAMGVGQQMPQTAQTLAGRLGMAWNPAMMTASTHDARKYQDAITGAAVDEAWNYANGNPEVAAMYYHGGSDRAKWGPKTRNYARSILGRLGGR